MSDSEQSKQQSKTDKFRIESEQASTSAKQSLAAKVTTVEKTQKIKGPRRVEAGKRLAAISR